MIPDSVSVTRLADYLPDGQGHRAAIERVLVDEHTGYPLHPGIETIGDLRRIGAAALAARFPDAAPRSFDWLFARLDPAAPTFTAPPPAPGREPPQAPPHPQDHRPSHATAKPSTSTGPAIMTATVKLIAYAGTIAAPVAPAGKFSGDSLFLLKQRYLARETLAPDTVTAAASAAATAPNGTEIVEVQVQDGKTVCYEVNPAGQTAVAATQASPWLSGRTILHFGPGWTLSVMEAV